jgi:DNA polymerase (family 10)
VRSRADLKKPAVLARLPRESQTNVLYPPARNTPLAVAEKIVAQLKQRLIFPVARCEVIPVGSVRRKAPRVKDMDMLVIAPPGNDGLVDQILTSVILRAGEGAPRLEIVATYISGKRRRSLVLRADTREPPARTRYYRVDLFAFTQAEKPFALFHYTGSTAYNIRTRAFAKRKGWRLNQYGVFETSTGRRVRGSSAIRSEEDLAEFLGISYRLPTDRQR